MFSELPKNPDRRAQLTELARILRISIDEADPQSRAALAKQLRDTLSELDQLPTAKQDTVDDVAKKRAQRRSKTPGTKPA